MGHIPNPIGDHIPMHKDTNIANALIKRGDLTTDRHARRKPCEQEGRNGVMLLQAKEYRRWPANHQRVGGRPGTGAPSQPSEGTDPADTLISEDFWPPQLGQ